MDISDKWNWNKIDTVYWSKPAEEMYYLIYRWGNANFKNILDLGCGIGRNAILFAENSFNVTGLDSSESGLKIFKEKASEKKLKIESVTGNIQNLPFPDNTFDAIIAYHSVYHTDSNGILKIINEIYRVLKPTGEIYFTFISKSTYSYIAPECTIIDNNVRLKREEDGNILPHYFVNYKDIKKLLHNFEIIKTRHVEDILGYLSSSWHYFILAKKNTNQEI